ncbi:hypothetical protein [Pseudomonas orientalis]|uniref:hypothetical protein n=1 Tax=Pseudomonas orientalis TaxID=76758 RepID=UPI000F05FAF3
MTFYIAPSFDSHYWCPNGHNNINGAVGVDRKTWTCSQCHILLDITMTDSPSLTYTVERHRANTIRKNDLIVYDMGNKRLACGKVHTSEAAEGARSATHWKLSVEDFGSAEIPAHQLVNRV